MIARLRLDPARTKLLSGFIDTYLQLRAEEQEKLCAQVKELPHKEEEKIMEIMTSWKREGIKEGLQQDLKVNDLQSCVEQGIKKF